MKRATLAFALLALLAACSSGGGGGFSEVAFYTEEISFEHSEAWRAQSFDAPQLVTYLSTAVLRAPCHTTAAGQLSCAQPIDELPPNGVLVAWFDGPKDDIADPNTRVGGQPAHKTVRKDGCPDIKGDEMITVRFDDPSHTTTYTMNACLRGPDLQRANVDAMLKSVRFLK